MSDPKQDWPTRTAAQHDIEPLFETLTEQVPDANLFGVTEALCSESPQDRASLAQRVTEVYGL